LKGKLLEAEGPYKKREDVSGLADWTILLEKLAGEDQGPLLLSGLAGGTAGRGKLPEGG
jgi:hypothetical protein